MFTGNLFTLNVVQFIAMEGKEIDFLEMFETDLLSPYNDEGILQLAKNVSLKSNHRNSTIICFWTIVPRALTKTALCLTTSNNLLTQVTTLTPLLGTHL